MSRNRVGWYFYAWAAEPFLVSAVGTYVPILLQTFALSNAVLESDHFSPCTRNALSPTDPQPGAPGTPVPPVDDGGPCVVNLLGWWVDPSSYALYTFSASVLVQTIVVISMSGAADKGSSRLRLTVGFAIVGAIATCLIFFTTAKNYYAIALLAIVSNSAFGAVTVCGNSILPFLVDEFTTSEYARLTSGDETETETAGSEAALRKEIARASAQISGTGVAIGYLGALIVQTITILIVLKLGSSISSLQYAILFVGIWWLVFQIPIAVLLKPPVGAPFHSKLVDKYAEGTAMRRVMLIRSYVTLGWRTIFVTFKEARQLRDVGIFLAGWFVISDALTTINSAAVLFAKDELGMAAPSLAVIGLLAVCSGIFGATMIPRMGLQGLHGIYFVIALASVLPLYGILGFFTSIFGLQHPWEMYLLAMWFGFAQGGMNAYCRSVFSLLIPRGKETTFFALFSVTDKGSSIVGPVVTGLITDRTHNIRYTFYFLFCMMVASLGIFSFLNLERGHQEAQVLETIDEED